jgi:hypothetical protein
VTVAKRAEYIQVVGVTKLPLDGNLNRNMGLIAHHGLVILRIRSSLLITDLERTFVTIQITDLCCSHDGQYLFTAGGEDCTINMWHIRPTSLEAQIGLRSNSDMLSFYDMLDPVDGAHGELYREMEDYFYYSQLLRYYSFPRLL